MAHAGVLMFVNRVSFWILGICATFGIRLGTARSATGTEVAYHFDRNALAATARASDGTYIALTDSGNLLAFDPATYTLVAERVPWSPATSLSATLTGVVAGLDDGRIVSVDVPSLKMQRIGAVDGHPAWIGRRRSGALLVAHGFAPDKPFGWGERGLASLVVEELGTGRSLRIPFVATAFLLDSRDRLWLGADNGEWGGRLAVVDLEKWTVRELKRPPAGVYGIVETIEGRIWVHGGTMHMGMHEAFVSALDGASQTTLFESGFVDRGRSESSDPAHHAPRGYARQRFVPRVFVQSGLRSRLEALALEKAAGFHGALPLGKAGRGRVLSRSAIDLRDWRVAPSPTDLDGAEWLG